jgi:hypothetical protein
MAFNKEEKEWKKWIEGNMTKAEKKGVDLKPQFEEFRKKWEEAGAIAFAEQVLKIDPENGGPLLLSNDQKEWLTDVTINNVQLSIISAGRGSGKTFVLAVYVCWRIFTNEFYHISCLGGSQDQSDKIQLYIQGWIRRTELSQYCSKNVQHIIRTYASSSATFHSCSGTSVRGPHVRELVIDEEAAGEEQNKTKFIKAAMWEVSTSKNLRIIKSSTPHLSYGDFLETWNDWRELGFKRYQWSITKHISGNINPYEIYKDKISKHWLSNVPWTTDDTIQKLRGTKSDEEWLVEALGCMSITSGLVFKPSDLVACICDLCETCEPYKEKKCYVVQGKLAIEGLRRDKIPESTRLALSYVGERVLGIDWGQRAPDDYTMLAKYGRTIFVLEQIELLGQSDQDKIATAERFCKDWHCENIRPDPEQWSYSNQLIDKGYQVDKIWEGPEGTKAKNRMVYLAKRVIERHYLVIPKAYTSLIRCLKNLTYDENGKIRKYNDHAFDSLIYAISAYSDEEEDSGRKEEPQGATLWKPEQAAPPSEEPKEDKENPDDESKEKDFNPFDEEYLKRKQKEQWSEHERGAKIW